MSYVIGGGKGCVNCQCSKGRSNTVDMFVNYGFTNSYDCYDC